MPLYALLEDVLHTVGPHLRACHCLGESEMPQGAIIAIESSIGLISNLGKIEDILGMPASETARERNRLDMIVS